MGTKREYLWVLYFYDVSRYPDIKLFRTYKNMRKYMKKHDIWHLDCFWVKRMIP